MVTRHWVQMKTFRIVCLVDWQITELKNTIKEMANTESAFKKKEEASELKLNQMKLMLQSVLDDRNLLSKKLLSANVICANLL